MEIDLAQAGTDVLDGLDRARAEVCIVGGGIAGLVLADRLAGAGVDVLLLEAGGVRPVTAEVELAGEAHLGSREGRPQTLGGSSLLWGGQLLPMLPGTPWPTDVETLQPFYPVVDRLLGVDDLSYEANAILQRQQQTLPQPLEQVPGLLQRMSKFAPFNRRNLGATLGKRLRHHPRVRLLLHARVLELHLQEDGSRVDRATVATPAGRRLAMSFQHIVLAAGTVETCRLLLASRSQDAMGVGNEHDQVGRNFHDHLTVEIAHFQGAARDRAVELFRPWIVGGLRGTLHALKLELGETLTRRFALNPALAHITFEEPRGSSLASLRELLRGRQSGDGETLPRSAVPGTLISGVGDMWRLQREAGFHGRRYISPEARVALRLNVAQEVPNRSRVGLAAMLDGCGQPLARVEWHHAANDLRTLRWASHYLRQHLLPIVIRDHAVEGKVPSSEPGLPTGEEASSEELLMPWPGVEDARHAMGGTCMGDNPQSSVVNRDLRVHRKENLWIASAAVFPDGRPHLPTMTLMSLALRLGDTLHALLRRRPG